MKKILFLFFLFSLGSYSQNLDSLLLEARATKDDSTKIIMLNKIAFSAIFNDTDKAIEIITEGEKLAQEKDLSHGLTKLTNTHGIYMDVTGKSDSANYYFTKALSLSKEFGFKNIEVMCTNNLGMFNWNKGNFENALNYFFEALKMNDDFGDEKASAIYLNNIGLIYQEMGLINKALEYHQKSYDVRLKYNNKKEQATSLNNIGICFKELERYEEAETTYKKGLIVAESSNNLRDFYGLYDNLGNLYQLQSRDREAISAYLKSLNIPEILGDNTRSKFITYSNLIMLYNKLNLPQKGLEYANSGLRILEKFPHYKNFSETFFLGIAESNYMLGNFNKARSYTERYVSYKDSVFSEENAKAIADFEIKYDTEKKEKQILVQRAELAEQDLVIQKRNYQIYGLLGLALLLCLIGFLFYNQQKLRNHQLQKEKELSTALVKIETQNKLQEQRLRISRDLHDNIGAQLTFIISSIDNLKYAFDIKDQKLNSKLITISDFTTSTIYELRDTIWAMNKSEISFEDLQIRISNFVDKANLAAQNIEFRFNVDENVDKTTVFTSVQGMNIYRITQEAINNALKYAEASKIKVEIFEVNNHVKIVIEDDGKGFDETNVILGNGLQNMKKRASDINGNLSIDSKENNGTLITLDL